MRKSLFFAAFACVALASCVTDDVSENNQEVKNPQKITFNAPVVSGITRAVAGEQPNGTPSKYSTNEKFRVYAMWSKSNYTTGNWDVNNLYMDGVEVAYGDATKNYWASEHVTGQNPYYWPEDGCLTFAAYSPADADADGTISYSADGLTINNFTVKDNCTEQYDLMYSIRSYNRTESKNNLTGDGHTTNSYIGVDILFKHALSSIKFKVKTNEEYTGTTIKIKKIEILNVSNKGTFQENITDGPTYVSDPKWDVKYASENLKDYTAWENATGQPVTNVAQDLNGISDIILLPQDMVNSLANKRIAIRVNYSITSGSGNEIAQENTLYLNDSDNDGTGNDYYQDKNTSADIAAWVMGKRYTYTINFGLDKIYFSPEVTNWTDVYVDPDLAI